MKDLLKRMLPWLDVAILLLVFPSAVILKLIRKAGVQRLPKCRNALIRIGVFPIIDHYYEPLFNFGSLSQPLSSERRLPGLNWDEERQLKFLASLTFENELTTFPIPAYGEPGYRANNESFLSGDAEIWYQIIRAMKPSRIIEIGSGNSTLVAIKAIAKNRELDVEYSCRHVCIEPFEMQWLESTPVEVLREMVENVGVAFFSCLEENDILFIDSSHMIRPQGDVLFEYLELLPTLKPGVIVHIHDIFTPRDYLSDWLENRVKFWNEQYLLEAFLTQNPYWEILAGVNFLSIHHFEKLKSVAPYLTPDRCPGSLYIKRV